MSGENFEHHVELNDHYAVTQSGDIRRVSIPRSLRPILIFAVTENPKGGSEALFDEVACEIADKERCSYAEAWITSLNFYQGIAADRLEAFALDELRRKETIKDYFRIQLAREQRWRRKHGEWREDLPPAID